MPTASCELPTAGCLQPNAPEGWNWREAPHAPPRHDNMSFWLGRKKRMQLQKVNELTGNVIENKGALWKTTV